MHEYRQCAALTEQIVDLKKERRQLEVEIAQLKRRQKRSQARDRSRSRSSTEFSSD